MPAWKVLMIGACACVCLALALAAVLALMVGQGAQRWLWVGGLLTATLVAGGLFAMLMRHVGASMDVKPKWSRR